MGFIVSIIYLAAIVLIFASYWKTFTKAGKPGWACLVPIYNGIVLLEIAQKPIWWIILFFIPIVGFIMWIMVAIALAENFGQSAGFGVGLALLPVVFFPILAFGSAQYGGVAAGVPPVQAAVPPAEAPAAPPAQQPPQEPPATV